MFGWFGWRKRNEGFEWRQYVRTTILVRREKRRQKLDDVREAAVNRLKEAGERGARASAEGAGKMGKAAKDGIVHAARSVSSGASSGFRERIAPHLTNVTSMIARAYGHVKAALSRVGAGQILLAAGLIACFWAVARTSSLGFDREALVAAGVAVAAATGYLLVWLSGRPEGRRLSAGLDRIVDRALDGAMWLARRLPRNRWVTGVDPRVFAAVLLGLGATIAGGLWFMSSKTTSMAALLPMSAAPEIVSGRATALSGDTLKIAGRNIRLAGIEAPELNQKCGLSATKRWSCGEAASQALTARVRSKPVRCEITRTAAPDGADARGSCQSDGVDIGAELVKAGHVFAEPGWFARYAALETEARSAKVGLWRGDAERPSDYRAKRWEQARLAAPDGCPIKGQLMSDRRVYVLPWSPRYDQIKVRATKGERWFCSEAEAQAAGWKPIERS